MEILGVTIGAILIGWNAKSSKELVISWVGIVFIVFSVGYGIANGVCK